MVQFTKATVEEVKRSLQRIIKSEKLNVNDESLEKIIKIAKGSFRDAVKLLEQYSKDETFLDNQNIFDAEKFATIVLAKDTDNALLEVTTAIKNGVSAENITMEVLTVLQAKLLEEKSDDLIKLIGLILSVQEYNKVSPIEELPLELAIIKWCRI